MICYELSHQGHKASHVRISLRCYLPGSQLLILLQTPRVPVTICTMTPISLLGQIYPTAAIRALRHPQMV